MNVKKKRPRHALRGNRLEQAALRELGDLVWLAGARLSWQMLSHRLGVTRQALATKPAVADAFRQAKEDQGRRAGETRGTVRRTLEERIDSLEQELRTKQVQLDRWVEKWATVEENCRRYGYDADKILEPLGPLPER